jgi:hypothetical protein
MVIVARMFAANLALAIWRVRNVLNFLLTNQLTLQATNNAKQ